MASGRDLLESEEKKSYGAVFVLTVGLLLACTVWAVWQDSFSRHLWKKYKADFYRLAIAKYEGDIAADQKRLNAIPEYVALEKDLTKTRESLTGGDDAHRLDELQGQLAQAVINVQEADLDLRVVKGEIEEAWYLLDNAVHEGDSGNPQRRHLHELMGEKDGVQAKYDNAVAHRAEVQSEIDSIRGHEEELTEKLRPYQKEQDAINQRLDAVSYEIFGKRIPRVPMVDQVVLPSFERNNFEQWVDRVERCMNCHVAIDRPGFEDQENPLKTHPDRAYYLGNHPVKKFGCTPCHGGQGASINSVEQAHGTVPFWEDPLANVNDMVQGRCMRCHITAQNVKGEDVAARGEWLFREMGCHGCHLVQGFDHLPKAGPSLRRIAAKVKPEWMVSWIQKPRAFRPRTRMPLFFLSREEATDVAAYVLSDSWVDTKAWLDQHPEPTGVDPNSPALVAKGKALTESLGCLGCHGFTPDQSPSQVAIGMDTEPNLARIAEKTDARWIYNWILNPREFSETARMPRLRLSEDEARAITSYLMTLKQQDPAAPDMELRRKLADPEHIANGEKLVRRYGCFGCHTIDGMASESRVSVELSNFSNKHLEEMFFGNRLDIPNTWQDWTFNKILTPRTYETERIEQNMPEFGFDPKDARALVVFLYSRAQTPINQQYLPDNGGRIAKIRRGREIISYYNCNGCHTLDGREGAIRRYYADNIQNAPPILLGEGLKVQPEWLFDFLIHPSKLRPQLKVRMPTFGFSGDEPSSIVKYLGALDGYDLSSVVLASGRETGPNIASLPTVTGGGAFDCRACHPAGPKRLDPHQYSVSRTPLTDDQVADWLEKNLGIERASQQESDKDKELREYLGAAAN